MAVTVSYDFANVKPEFIIAHQPGSEFETQILPSVVAMADGGFAVSYQWFEPVGFPEEFYYEVALERYAADGNFRPSGGFDGVSYIDLQSIELPIFGPAGVQLANGRLLTVWTESQSGIHYGVADPATGAVLVQDAGLEGTSLADVTAAVAALDNGGFAVVARNGGGFNLDCDIRFHNANGQLLSETALGLNSVLNEGAPAIAALKGNANVVVVYEKELADDSFDHGMAFEIFTEAGAAVGGPVLFDSFGDDNRRPDVVALDDGGFAVGYEDNGWGEDGLTVWFFDAAGASRGFVRADGGAGSALADDDVSLSLLANGFVAVSWTGQAAAPGNADIRAAVIDPATVARIGGPFVIEGQTGSQYGSSLAGLSNGTLVSAWSDQNTAIEDGNTSLAGTHVSMQIDAFRQVHRGDGANDIITGDALIDVMYGEGGDDTLIGLGAADILNGGSGSDTASYAGGAARVKVSLASAFAAEGDAVGDTFISIARLTGTSLGDVLGGDGNGNVIRGGNGNDTIRGEAGGDLLSGEAGADRLVGGLGDDRFNYAALGHGGDLISDFSNATGNDDSLRFTGAAFGGLPAGALAANRFAANTAGLATTADHRFIYETDTGILRFDANGTGAGAVTVIATLTGAPALSAADIAII